MDHFGPRTGRTRQHVGASSKARWRSAPLWWSLPEKEGRAVLVHLCARITDARPAFSAERYSAANSRARFVRWTHIRHTSASPQLMTRPGTRAHAQFVFATTGPDDQQWRDPTIRQPRTIDASHGHRRAFKAAFENESRVSCLSSDRMVRMPLGSRRRLDIGSAQSYRHVFKGALQLPVFFTPTNLHRSIFPSDPTKPPLCAGSIG